MGIEMKPARLRTLRRASVNVLTALCHVIVALGLILVCGGIGFLLANSAVFRLCAITSAVMVVVACGAVILITKGDDESQ
jgi:hypothetical protein